MKRSVITVLVLICVASAPAAAAELSIATDFPIVGKPVTVSVSGTGPTEALELRVVYAPNSETQTVEEIGRFSPGGTVDWNPRRFGIATLTATDETGEMAATENVAILPAAAPPGGVLVMLFAGVLLFGGAGYSLRSVLRSGVPEQMPPVDT
jgi:hypothetical protein